MDKHRVEGILALYSPPLSSSQVDAIAVKIAKVSAEEIERLKPARKKSRKSKSQK